MPIILPSSLHELALFAGAGGGILGGLLCGFRTVCAVEHDAYARDVLVARQNDGCLHPFPIWDDVCTFDGTPWRGLVDVVSGGFPCQDISVAGKGAGLEGERSGLWGEMRRIIGEVRPRYVLVENSPALTLRGGVRVTAELAAMGYVGRNGVLGAVHAGAPHKRERIWFVADPASHGRNEGIADGRGRGQRMGARSKQGSRNGGKTLANSESIGSRSGLREDDAKRHGDQSANGGGDVADTNGARCEEQRSTLANGTQHEAAECGGWWSAEPDVGRVAHGVAARVDRLRCLGNGQVPAVVALAWNLLKPMES